MTAFKQFADRYNKRDDARPSTQADIEELEKELGIQLPGDYKIFLLTIGSIWTPDILNLVVDRELEMYDVSQFWYTKEIIDDKKNWWTAKVSTDIIPFASDSGGNIFAFLTGDLKEEKETAAIYFYDHDFETVEKIAESFKDWLDNFNKI